MLLPETARKTRQACVSCHSAVNMLVIRAANGTVLWYRCQRCGAGWNVPAQLPLLLEAV